VMRGKIYSLDFILATVVGYDCRYSVVSSIRVMPCRYSLDHRAPTCADTGFAVSRSSRNFPEIRATVKD
jgi:hypothetical protein